MYRLSHLLKGNHLNLLLLEMISKSLYYSTGLPVSILDQAGNTAYTLGIDGHVNQLFPRAVKELPQFAKEQLITNGNGIYVYDSTHEFSYLSMILSDNNVYHGMLLLGPYMVKPIDEHLINEVLNDHKFSLTQRDLVKSIFTNLPVLSASRSYYIQQMVLSLVTNINVQDLFPSEDLHQLMDDANFSVKQAIEVEKTDHNYALELLFLTKVKNGDIEKVVDLYNEHIKTQFLNQHVGEPVRGAKNRAFSFSTLMARAIVDGGVEAEKSLAIEDYYRERIESTRNLKDLVDLIEQMVVKYTNNILQLSNINHVSVIKNASKYVHMHLSEPIRLNDVANFVNLSPNYFSSLFKREMNLSFADYVNQTRIKESQYLLETTSYSILDIAISVGYNNQNYFTTIFRKFTGITPKQYRMRSTK